MPADRERYLDALIERDFVEVIGECRYGNFGQRAHMVRFADALLTATEEA